MRGKKFIFDLSKVYGPIPTTLNGKEFDVSPDDHKIDVKVNTDTGLINSAIKNPDTKNEDDDNSKKDLSMVAKPKAEEVDADTVEEVLDEHRDKSEEEISEEEAEEKEEIMDQFEKNMEKKMKGLGIDPKDIKK